MTLPLPTDPVPAADTDARRGAGRRRERGLGTVLAAAVLSAVLASGGTAVLVEPSRAGAGSGRADGDPRDLDERRPDDDRPEHRPHRDRRGVAALGRHDHGRRHLDRRVLAVRGADPRGRIRDRADGERLHPDQPPRGREQHEPHRRARGRDAIAGDARRAGDRQRPRARQGGRHRPHARPHRRLVRGRGGPDRDRDREPARDLHGDGHPGDRVRARPRGHRQGRRHRPPDDAPRPAPDRRRDQPRQQRRPAARRERRGHRHQHGGRVERARASASRSRSTTRPP